MISKFPLSNLTQAFVAICAVALLSSCASPPTNPTGKSTGQVYPTQTVPARLPIGQPAPPPTYQPPVYQPPVYQPPIQQPVPTQAEQTRSYGSFSEWKQDFMAQARGRYGYSADQLFAKAQLNSNIIALDNNQAEFTKAPWSYLDGAVTDNRVAQARQKRREMLGVLDRAESLYGVPASIVTAIWAVESSFGAGMGNIDLVNALSSLAYDGRRREFAEGQLLAMNELVARGDVSPSELKGSFAGGMGHTQFIPTTWLAQAVDADGDGRKSPFSRADALTTTANYLANAGWVRGLPAYVEVAMPSNFNHRLIGQKLSLDDWARSGLMSMSDTALMGQHQAELWLPAGINGPKLLLTANFNVIKVYNNSSNYALAVATLAERMNGKAGISADFPRYERMLSRNEIQALQQRLTTLGYDTKGVDGVAGTNTRLAFARWQADNGRVPDGFISQNSVSGLIW